MCKHSYQRLDYLVLYPSNEFTSSDPSEKFDEALRGVYPGNLGVTKTIIVLQCINCGEVKIEGNYQKVFRKICQAEQDPLEDIE